jgi:hypothetical protein
MKIIANDSDRKDLIGQEVEIVRVVRDPEEGFDEEVLPMAYVHVISTGEQILVWPDEIDEPFPEA